MLKIKDLRKVYALIGAGITIASFSGCTKIKTAGPAKDNNSTSITISNSVDEVDNNEEYWWPIGSIETFEENGKIFASKLPVESIIVKKFAPRNDILSQTVREDIHEAIDIITNKEGETNIIASKSGVVIYPRETDRIDYNQNDIESSGYGNYVIIKHADGNYTLYAHLKANTITVKAGDEVKQGQVIGILGDSGRTSGDNLHFEIRVDGITSDRRVNPESYVKKDKPRETNKPEFIPTDQVVNNAAQVIKTKNKWELKLDDITLYTIKDEDLLYVLNSLSYHLKKDSFSASELKEYHLEDVIINFYKEESYSKIKQL